jgi:hypothetical protein
MNPSSTSHESWQDNKPQQAMKAHKLTSQKVKQV